MVPAAADIAGEDVTALVARARELRATGHPATTALWERVGAALERTGTEPDALLAVELREHRALAAGRAGAPDARAGFEEVAAGFRAAGEESRAALNDLRTVYAALDGGAAPKRCWDCSTPPPDRRGRWTPPTPSAPGGSPRPR
ncbi:hypothetical protein ACFQ60_41935 [Streptomyces zhihengii]